MRAISHRSIFLPLMALMCALAWFMLWLWSASPYVRYLDHGSWTEIGQSAAHHMGHGGELGLSFTVYMGAWLLMSAAMMLPTTLPLLEIFRRVTSGRADQGLMLSLVIAGYLGVWGLFGLVAHVADMGLRTLAQSSPWFAANAWIFGAGVLAIAGLFQFSSLKYHCLDRCRTPLSFMMRHWNGRRERLNAFLLEVDHGAFCVGCCWALMLLMFVVGMGSIGWMLVLAAAMAVEKNVPWGNKLSAPLGVGLLVWSAAIAVQHLVLT